MNTHISYETAKRLKEFLGESAPRPLDWSSCASEILDGYGRFVRWEWTYQLHDLLSKPFCEAMVRERFASGLNKQAAIWEATEYLEKVLNAYYNGGLPAVEKELMRMMGEETK